jgi:hypothetical protein
MKHELEWCEVESRLAAFFRNVNVIPRRFNLQRASRPNPIDRGTLSQILNM